MPSLILNIEFQIGVLLDGDVLAIFGDDITPDLFGDGRDVGARTGDDESVEVNSQLKKEFVFTFKIESVQFRNLSKSVDFEDKTELFSTKISRIFPRDLNKKNTVSRCVHCYNFLLFLLFL
jgi:hypothetical protein